MNHSESIAQVAAALAAANAGIKSVGKDRSNSHFGNKYATLDAIMDAVRAPLAEHGLSIVQGCSETPEGFQVWTMLLHKSGEYLANVVPVPVNKKDAQGIGSAMTYGRRYGVSGILAVATEEDDDGNNAAKSPPKKAEQKPKAEEKAEPPKPVDPKPDKPVREWDGTDTDALGFPFPVKGHSHHGKPMGEMSDEALQKFVAWAGVKPDWINVRIRAEAILNGRTK